MSRKKIIDKIWLAWIIVAGLSVPIVMAIFFNNVVHVDDYLTIWVADMLIGIPIVAAIAMWIDSFREK